jgi:hypothetical protein
VALQASANNSFAIRHEVLKSQFMEPGEALSTAAQIAVALAGFAGVVVVFRRESVHEWSPIDKFRLRLLLMNSVLPLALCMLGLLFLTIKPLPLDIWKWCSGFAFVVFVLFAITSMTIFRRLDLRELQSYGRATHFVFYLFGVVGTAVMVLQLYNVIILGVFWPFFTGIVFQLVAAMFQFMRIILIPPE